MEPISDDDDLFVHIYGELNAAPDALAKLRTGQIICHKSLPRILIESNIIAQFDGCASGMSAGATFCIWSSADTNFEKLDERSGIDG